MHIYESNFVAKVYLVIITVKSNLVGLQVPSKLNENDVQYCALLHIHRSMVLKFSLTHTQTHTHTHYSHTVQRVIKITFQDTFSAVRNFNGVLENSLRGLEALRKYLSN